MPRLHYGPAFDVELDPADVRLVSEAIGAHATRGGWVTVTDHDGREWTILVTPGVPIWIEPDAQSRPASAAQKL